MQYVKSNQAVEKSPSAAFPSSDLSYVRRVHPFNVVGFGALNLDLIFEVEELSSLSTEKVQLHPGRELWGSEENFRILSEQLKRCGTLKSKSGGGSAANTIVALARMGFSTKFIGKVGQDDEGDFLLEQLGLVQKELIQRGGRSGVCIVVLDRHNDRFLLVRGNANSTLTSHTLDPDALREVSWIHLTSFTGNLPFEAQKNLGESRNPGIASRKPALEDLTACSEGLRQPLLPPRCERQTGV